MTDPGDWWRGAVIYQIYPRSFQDTDGDGVGDLPGVTRRLPYVAALGVDAIWLSPFFTSPMADMGYDVSDYCDVDPIFGTLAEFDALVAEAHRLGLKVIIDQVISHSSDRHPWFVESRKGRANPKADWYVWAEPKPDGTAPNNWLSVFGGPAWEWDSTRRQYYLHNFLASQPDLNFHNPEVRKAMLASVRFWLERGVDGFRLDTVNYYFHDRKLRDNPPVKKRGGHDVPETNPYGFQDHLYDKNQPENIEFLREFRSLLNQYANRTAVGEVGDGQRSLEIVASYTAAGDKLHMCYTFDLLGPEFHAGRIAHYVRSFEAASADGWVCWAMSNHDVTRHLTRFLKPGDDPVRVASFAIALLSCLRGTLCLYQGEELGLEEAEIAFEDLRDPYGIRFWPGFKGRDGCRTPMVWEAGAPHGGFSTGKPWLPVPAAHLPRAVDRSEAEPVSVLNRYRQWLAFRKAHAALARGTIEILSTRGDVLAFLRETQGERLLCVFNFNRKPASYAVPETLGPLANVEAPGALASVEGGRVRLDALASFVGGIG